MDKNKIGLLLVGAGGLGRVIQEQARYEYDCFFVDDRYDVGTIIQGIPVIGKVSDLSKLKEIYGLLVVAIGNNYLREKIYIEAVAMGYEFPNIIFPSAYISPFAKIGKGCLVLQNVCIQNSAVVGDGVILNAGVEIHHGGFVNDYSLIYTNSVIRTEAKIGSRVRIGSNVTVSNGVMVPDDSDIHNGLIL